MIKANELRIGNHVMISPVYHKEDIRFVDYKMIQAVENGFEVYGIPLTPEILGKCEFDWSIYHQAFHKDNFEFDIVECYPKGYALTTFKRGLIIVPNFQYLHELQNIVYILTGEELEIKELANLTTHEH